MGELAVRLLTLRAWYWRYGVAFLAVCLAWGSRELVLSGERSPFLAFGLAVLVSALAGGFGPAMMAAGLSAMVAGFFYLPPQHALSIDAAVDLAELGLFAVEGLVAAAVGESLRRSIRGDLRSNAGRAGTNERASDVDPMPVAHRTVASPWIEPLSERELVVVRLLATGLTNDQIAATLFLSRNTVKTHLKHVYEKLGVRTRTEAVARCLELGVLAPQPTASERREAFQA
jgi:DNA-binding NarL/FixJ family response regulator